MYTIVDLMDNPSVLLQVKVNSSIKSTDRIIYLYNVLYEFIGANDFLT